MNTLTPERRDEDWEGYQDGETDQLPRRPRRQFFNRRTAALGALLACAIGFYAGIRIEKSQMSSSGAGTAATGTSAAGARARSAFASLFAGRGGAASSGATGGGAAGATGGAPGGAAFGTVASISGKTLYVTETSGNTVKVKLTSATKVSKTQSVSRSAIHPGDSVVVSGVSGSGGAVSAASVTDSGTRSGGFGGASGSSGSGSSGSGGSGSGSSVGSLFSSGG